MSSSNTLLSDINEIYTGYVLNGSKWYDEDAKRQYNLRVGQVQPMAVADAQGKATVMAKEFVKWAHANGYSGKIKNVWWTARPNSMSEAVGQKVDQKKNPTDILVKFEKGPADGFLGLSAKATQTKGEIGFKNPGLGTVDESLGLSLAKEYDNQLQQAIKKFKLPETAVARKVYIRDNPGIQKHTQMIGSQILAAMRAELLARMKKLDQKKLLAYLLSDWMDAEVMYPPYIKVTGQGYKEPYQASVMDPISNEKLDALTKQKITLEPVGNEGVGVRAGTKKIMRIRFKFESEKLASGIKLSGEPW